MIKEAVIWLYARGVSALTALFAITLSLLGVSDAGNKAHLLISGERTVGTVIEMIVQPPSQSAKPEAAKPEAGPAAAPPQTASAPTAGAPAAEAKPVCLMKAPKVRYDIGDGKERIFTSTTFACPTSFEKDKTVIVRYDPANPDDVILSSDGSWWTHFLVPALLLGFSAMSVGLAWALLPTRQQLDKLLSDPAHAHAVDPTQDDSRAVALADTPRPPGAGHLSGIVASAQLIEAGKYPLDLCEFAAYMAALAYEPLPGETAQKGQMPLVDYLKLHCPHLTHVSTFRNDGTEGFGFMVDGAAFIVMRGTVGWQDWSRNLKANTTGPAEFIPRNADWLNPPRPGWQMPARHWGFAQAFDVIRDDVEGWVATLPDKDKTPFVFAGHSLGGALSFLGAFEFALRGRKVEAVLTFGAAIPGKTDFHEHYAKLGLDKRTLRLEFTQDIVPEAQKIIGYREVGQTWEPQRLPLTSQQLALGAVPFNWVVGRLGSSLIPVVGKKADKTADATVNTLSSPAPTSGPPAASPPMSRTMRRWMLRLVIFLAFSSILALAAHKMQRRYAMALSIMSYRRQRARLITSKVAGGGTGTEPADFAASYDWMRGHLKAVRGTTPETPGPFGSIAGLPRRVEDAADLKWLNTFHAARMW